MVKRNSKGQFVKENGSTLEYVGVKLPRSLKQQITVAAELGDCTRTDIIIKAIETWLLGQRMAVKFGIKPPSKTVVKQGFVPLPDEPAGHGKDPSRVQPSAAVVERDDRYYGFTLKQICQTSPRQPYEVCKALVQDGDFAKLEADHGIVCDRQNYKTIRSKCFARL